MTNDIQAIHFDSIIMNLNATSPKDILKKLSTHTSNIIGAPQNLLYNALSTQEKEQSSDMGNGVAITHMRLPRLTKALIVFTKLNKAVDFKKVNGEPVDMVCLVLSPEYEGPKHLSRLATISRLLSSRDFCQTLRSANDADDIRLALKELNQRKMAA